MSSTDTIESSHFGRNVDFGDPAKVWIGDEDKKFIQSELKRYEHHYSAIIPALFCIQRTHGWVHPKAVAEMTEITKIPEAHINEVLNFYTMFNKVPVGKLHVQVCTNVSCAMNGGRELAEHICKTFNVNYGEVSSEGLVTVNKVECLGACHNAPMMQINDNYYENLTHESAIETIQNLSSQKLSTQNLGKDNK
jgi:NADH-quinone oxidoreductase subunit E